jgi:UDP-sulfoquinovose synthase
MEAGLDYCSQDFEKVVAMRVLILGGDGYLGWPTAMSLSAKGHDVYVIDNHLKRSIASQCQSESLIDNPYLVERAGIFRSISNYGIRAVLGDCASYLVMINAFRRFIPDAVIHYAEQPSAPFSMIGHEQARLTLNNNLNTTLNLIWAVLEHMPHCHIIKLGSMGEYGTPDIDIEEGWLEVEHFGREDTFLYPRQGGSLYHTTKIHDTDLLWFYVRMYGLKVTDLMQGPVYGLATNETDQDGRLSTSFHYDDIFGTVVNRFLVQAVAGVPLTVYGEGNQTRGYINLKDTLQCVELALNSPPNPGELRILNQFTETFSVNELAEKIKAVGDRLGLNVKIGRIENPRLEAESHYYNPTHTGLLELGLKPHFMTDDVIASMLEKVSTYKEKIDTKKIMPRVTW